jgi:hypothetical protein
MDRLAVSAGGGKRPVERAAVDEKDRHFLDEPAGVCYCFSEMSGKPARPSNRG